MICAQLWTRNDTRAEVWLTHSHTRVYAFRTCASLESADTMRAGRRRRHFHFLILRHASSSERDVASCHSPPASRHAVLFSRSVSSAGCFVDLSHLPPSAVFECFNPVPSASVVPWSSVSAENEAARTCEEAELPQHLHKTVKRTAIGTCANAPVPARHRRRPLRGSSQVFRVDPEDIFRFS